MPIIAFLGVMVLIAFFVGWSTAIIEACHQRYEGLLVMGYMTTAIVITMYYLGGP